MIITLQAQRGDLIAISGDIKYVLNTRLKNKYKAGDRIKVRKAVQRVDLPHLRVHLVVMAKRVYSRISFKTYTGNTSRRLIVFIDDVRYEYNPIKDLSVEEWVNSLPLYKLSPTGLMLLKRMLDECSNSL